MVIDVFGFADFYMFLGFNGNNFFDSDINRQLEYLLTFKVYDSSYLVFIKLCLNYYWKYQLVSCMKQRWRNCTFIFLHCFYAGLDFFQKFSYNKATRCTSCCYCIIFYNYFDIFTRNMILKINQNLSTTTRKLTFY